MPIEDLKPTGKDVMDKDKLLLKLHKLEKDLYFYSHTSLQDIIKRLIPEIKEYI